ncbi:diguanylate cyclase [Pseudomaricurvus sp.]|uniref:sensor domain-containing diguanylate cyclase n=1 Tax=Pseudomaricurvus sp. TaxID=2004510 RepID=UPI003F6A772F
MLDDNTHTAAKSASGWNPHRLAKAILIPRYFAYCHTFGLSVWIAMESGEGWSLISPAFLLLVWPMVAYCHSALATNSKRAEFQNLYIDCLLLGGWGAMLGYYLWSTLALGLGCLLNNLIVGGTRRLLIATLLFLLGGIGIGLFTGFDLRPEIGFGANIYLCAGYSIYFLGLGYTTYAQNRKIGRNIKEIQFKNRVFQSLLDIGAVANRAPDVNTLFENSLQHLCSNFPNYGFAAYLYEHERPGLTRYSAVAGINRGNEQHLLKSLSNMDTTREGVIHLDTRHNTDKFYAASMAGRLSLYEGWLVVRAPRKHDVLEEMLPLLIDELASSTENKLLHLELHKAAERDGLTGVYNRGFFETALKENIQRKAQQPDCDFAVLMIDLDGFKKVNDQLGHIAGDNLIMKAAQHIRNHCRHGDVLARYGGDEFVLLCPSSGIDQVNQIADRISQSLEQKRFSVGTSDNPIKIPLFISMGTASSEDLPTNEVLMTADKRMYANKLQRRQDEKLQINSFGLY